MTDQFRLEQLLDEDVREQLRVIAQSRLRRGSYSWETSDLMQEALLRVIKGHRQNWSSRGHFYGYLVHSVHSAYIDYLRERNSLSRGEGHRPVSIEHHVDFDDGKGTKTYGMNVLVLEEILAQVPRDRAEIILLRTFMPWTLQEIAEALDLPLSRIRTTCAWFEMKVREAVTTEARSPG